MKKPTKPATSTASTAFIRRRVARNYARLLAHLRERDAALQRILSHV